MTGVTRRGLPAVAVFVGALATVSTYTRDRVRGDDVKCFERAEKITCPDEPPDTVYCQAFSGKDQATCVANAKGRIMYLDYYTLACCKTDPVETGKK